MNREIKTNLHNILSHIHCAEDYGYDDEILLSDFALLTGWVTDEEIQNYITMNKNEYFTEEDYLEWKERLINWRNNYCDKG